MKIMRAAVCKSRDILSLFRGLLYPRDSMLCFSNHHRPLLIRKWTNVYQAINSTSNARSFGTSSSIMASSTPTGNESIIRQNYHEESEEHINKQINMELYASYVYISMAYYFDRHDVALPGLHEYFEKASHEEREDAEKLLKYQNKRGGRIILQPIAKPTQEEWSSPVEAVTAALELEKTVNQALLDLHGVASRNNDPELCDFLETEFLKEQVKSIKELADHLTNFNRAGKGLGEVLYDKEIKKPSD